MQLRKITIVEIPFCLVLRVLYCAVSSAICYHIDFSTVKFGNTFEYYILYNYIRTLYSKHYIMKILRSIKWNYMKRKWGLSIISNFGMKVSFGKFARVVGSCARACVRLLVLNVVRYKLCRGTYSAFNQLNCYTEDRISGIRPRQSWETVFITSTCHASEYKHSRL